MHDSVPPRWLCLCRPLQQIPLTYPLVGEIWTVDRWVTLTTTLSTYMPVTAGVGKPTAAIFVGVAGSVLLLLLLTGLKTAQ